MKGALQEAVADRIEFAAEDGNELTQVDAMRAILADIEDGVEIADPKLLVPIRRELIRLGVFVEISQDEIDRTQATGKKFDFRLQGKRFVFTSWTIQEGGVR